MVLAAASGIALSQTDRPSLTTRKEYANSNLLFSREMFIAPGFEVPKTCIRVQPNGKFHRENSTNDSKPKYAEEGQLSEEELAELKAMIDDAEFKMYRQDPDAAPKTVSMQVGYRLFSLTVVRGEGRPQELTFVNTAKTTAEPPKMQALHKRLTELGKRKDPALQRAQVDGCREHIDRPAPK